MKLAGKTIVILGVVILSGSVFLLWNFTETEKQGSDRFHIDRKGQIVPSPRAFITQHAMNTFVVNKDENPTSQIHERIRATCKNCTLNQGMIDTLDTITLQPTRDLSLVLEGQSTFPPNFTLQSKTAKLDLAYSLFVNNEETSRYKNHNMNAKVSRNIALNRTVEDTRSVKCQSKYDRSVSEKMYSDTSVSIIIPFHNEEYSMFLRALHSIYRTTTPKRVLHEVILVDDSCTFQNLQHSFHRYVQYFPKLKLYRTHHRQGLIRSRQLGAMVATGKVLVFLDAHIECQNHWLEPLLDVLAERPTAVAVPTIDSIDPESLRYKLWSRKQYGIFSWELDFVWKDIPSNETPLDETETIPSPTMIGCAFAIRKETFMNLGAYDEDMWIWGGENLEFSFRAWMCGGGLHLVPCSHVGHLFRSHLPYSFPTAKVINKNLQRVAEVWMAGYKQYYYISSRKCIPFTRAEKVTLERRKQFMQTLKCHTFKWYLDNVAKGISAPSKSSILFGQMRSMGVKQCLTYGNSSNSEFLRLLDCPFLDPLQTFSFSKDSLLIHQHSKLCLEHVTELQDNLLRMSKCNTSSNRQVWVLDPVAVRTIQAQLQGVDTRKPVGMFRLKYNNFQLCLTALPNTNKNNPLSNNDLSVSLCDVTKTAQFWLFTHSLNWRLQCTN